MNEHADDHVLASVNAYSNNIAGYQEAYRNHRLELPRRFSAMLPKNSRVLDLGCGPGRDLDIFAADGHTATGLDLNADFVEMASCHHNVLHADMRALAQLFPVSTFDGIWAQASLVHLSGDDARRVLADGFQLLKSNGIFYTCVPTTGETGWKTEQDGTRWYTVWPETSFVTEIEEAGFLITEYTPGSYIEVWARKP